jgi:Zn-dependent peptidase ImmA (M78 family)
MTDFYRAPPVSWNRIAEMTDAFRRQLNLEDTKFFPIMEVLEEILDLRLGLVRIEVEDDRVMGNLEAFTDPAGEFIRFSQTVYLEACANKVRARWTAVHEAGHFFLHTREPLARVASEVALKIFERPELQAHQFAAELLMPRKFIDPSTPVAEIMRDFGVSEEAAKKRLKFIISLHRNS